MGRVLSFKRVVKRMPTDDDLYNIPRAVTGEFELTEKETRRLRGRIYAINKDGICRYRTLRDGPILMVWRIK